ncbi:hypothetical protein FMEAI12_7030002 [Parafrankia sp. Ea1.12]|nr:hypothetical protein FMEAI12_7030002 [Parafrankia sp. Ea1.12]
MRRGEQYVVIDPTSAARFASKHVVVRNIHREDAPAAVARMTVNPDQPTGVSVAYLDQTLRNGIGVEVGETVELFSAVGKQTAMADWALAPRNYVMCRVQAASLPTVEHQICTAHPLVLSVLGVENGDEVVIEGIPAGDALLIPVCRLKIFSTPAEAIEQRNRLSGGDLTTRYPSSRDALGVYPDLPWIFLDGDTRSALGLGNQKLAVVRVRASRKYQVAKEVREILLLLFLAFFGLIGVLKSGLLVAIAAFVLVILAVGAIHRRLRWRLFRKSLPVKSKDLA